VFLVDETHWKSHKNAGRGEASYTCFAGTVHLAKVNSVLYTFVCVIRW
jgi:hypothetical protein